MSPNDLSSCSFRDPCGFVFTYKDLVYRQINQAGKNDYDTLMNSGLYNKLVTDNLLIKHEESDIVNETKRDKVYKTIRPEQLKYISYPYEWSFSQLQDAALATLAIQKTAMEYGMTLKDASAYNIQFHRCQPLLIDTLSLEEYTPGSPWQAYRQFCQHFLAPLALMSYCDIRMGRMSRLYIDGIPLDLAANLLPWRSRLNLGILTHVHLHAGAQKKYAGNIYATRIVKERKISKLGFQGIIESLENTVKNLRWRGSHTEWGDYYNNTNYDNLALNHKKQLVKEYLEQVCPTLLWDLGANTGEFSRIAVALGIKTIAFDIDPIAVETNYRQGKKEQEKILPLLLDLTNPSGAIGWNNRERRSFAQRGPADTVMALALIHHLAISNNVPLSKLSEFFAGLGRNLIIEFVPKADTQVKKLLATRKDIFPDYNQTKFESVFSCDFDIIRCDKIEHSERTIYLMRNKNEE